MKYRANQKGKDFAKALGLDKAQETRLKNAISKAYSSIKPDTNNMFAIDEINAFVAPYIRTAEEGFYCGAIIIGDVMGAAMEMGVKPIDPNVN